MFRHSLVVLAGLGLASPVGAATWADGLFEEMSKDFGTTPRGPTLNHPFHLTNKTAKAVSIGGVRVSCGCVTASALKNRLGPGESTAVMAYMDTSRFSGSKTVTVFVQFVEPQSEEVRLSVTANSRDDLSLSPEVLAFGQVKRGTTPSANVTVTFYGHNQVQVTGATCDSNYVQTEVKEKRRQDGEVSYQVTAKVRPDTPAGKWYTDVWLKTNSPAMPKVRVPLTVEVEAALSVNPPAATFGKVKAGAQEERRITIRGAKPFRITSVSGADDQVLVQANTTESKAAHVVTVTLKGAKPGEVSRTLKVVTDLAEDNEVEIAVKGQVVP